MAAFLTATVQPSAIAPVAPVGILTASRKDVAVAAAVAPVASAVGASWGTRVRGNESCVALAVGLAAGKRWRKRGGAARRAAASAEVGAFWEAGADTEICGICSEPDGDVAMLRRQVTIGAAIFAVMGTGGYASAKQVTITEKNCANCGGAGTVSCGTCGSTGQVKAVSAGGHHQQVGCPDCNAVGQRACEQCVGGSGLSA